MTKLFGPLDFKEFLKLMPTIPGPIVLPDLKEFLKLKFWAIHEASFILTNWPKTDLFYVGIPHLPEDIAEERQSFVFPRSEFDPEEYDGFFRNVFSLMKTSIETGVLPAEFVPIVNHVCFLVKPLDVLWWASMHKFILPDILQEFLEFKLLESTVREDALINKVKHKIVAQFILTKDASLSLKKIIEHPLMQYFGVDTEKKVVISRPKTFENNINELFEKKKPRKYTPKAIPEIMCEEDGRVKFNPSLFFLGMVTAAHIKIYQMFEKDIHDPIESFLESFKEDSVVRLYLDKAPERIKELVRRRIVSLYPVNMCKEF